jgi:spermidine synthase
MTGVVHDTGLKSVRLSYDVTRVLERTQTPYQELVVVENETFGRVLLLDGATQLTSADEFVYHEMLAHVPILGHGAVRDVLIIGGGDCGLAEEVLKHTEIQRVVQVEIDAAVVDVSRRHFAAMNGPVFQDERFQLQIGDGAAYVRSAAENSFDLVLIDSTDPTGAAMKLFSVEFYRNVRHLLRPRGILVAQAGVPFVQQTEFAAAARNIAAVFAHTSPYLIASPGYFGGHLALLWGSDEVAPTSYTHEALQQRFAAARLQELRYYTPEVDRAAFALPVYVQEAFAAAVRAAPPGAGA